MLFSNPMSQVKNNLLYDDFFLITDSFALNDELLCLTENNDSTLAISNSNPNLAMHTDLMNFFETMRIGYKMSQVEKVYKIFDDITAVSMVGKKIELQIKLQNNNNFVIIDKIKLPNSIEQCLNECYITSNGKIVVKYNEIHQKILNLSTTANENIENVVNCGKDVCLHLFFNNKMLNTLINNVICVSFVNIYLNNKPKYFLSNVDECNEIIECAFMF